MLLGAELDPAARVLTLTASVALAALTVEYVERPIRFGAAGPRAPWALAACLAALGVAGLLLQASNGMVDAYPRNVQQIARADFEFNFAGYRGSRCFLDLESGPSAFAPECWPAAGSASPVTLLWGDSHAAALYPGFANVLAHEPGGRGLAQFTKARCPPMAEPPSGASRMCRETNAHVLRSIRANPPDTVVLAGYWSLYDSDNTLPAVSMAGLRDTVTQLERIGVRHIVVMGHMPTWTSPLPRILLREWRRSSLVPERTQALLDLRARQLDRNVRAAVVGTAASFVSPLEALCDERGCLVSRSVAGESRPLVHDESHLTIEGSIAFVERSRAELFN
jgi:hypothetical protein